MTFRVVAQLEPMAGAEISASRVAALEAHMKHMATRAWVLGGVVGGAVLAVGIALTFIKFFGT